MHFTPCSKPDKNLEFIRLILSEILLNNKDIYINEPNDDDHLGATSSIAHDHSRII